MTRDASTQRNLVALLAAEYVDDDDPHGLNSEMWQVIAKNKYDKTTTVVASNLTRDDAFQRAGLQ